MDYKAIKEKYKKNQAAFIEMRTKQEVQINTFFEKISCITEPIFEGKVEIPKNATLQTLVPEYYAEHPRQSVLDEQIDAVNELCEKINNVLMEICEEAAKCCSEYQVLASSK